jgi:hypothetical protein
MYQLFALAVAAQVLLVRAVLAVAAVLVGRIIYE